jgi:hypothetical protein
MTRLIYFLIGYRRKILLYALITFVLNFIFGIMLYGINTPPNKIGELHNIIVFFVQNVSFYVFAIFAILELVIFLMSSLWRSGDK